MNQHLIQKDTQKGCAKYKGFIGRRSKGTTDKRKRIILGPATSMGDEKGKSFMQIACSGPL